MKVVISQPMFLPWIGLFEQVRLADYFVHYDNVQLPQGRSFMNRVQVKTATGIIWLTAPLKNNSRALINEVCFDDTQDWRKKHLATWHNSLSRAKYFNEAKVLLQTIYDNLTNNLSEFNIYAIETIAKYLNLYPKFLKSSDLQITQNSSERLLEIVDILNGHVYITGHGAKNYLDYQLFEENNVDVQYMNYTHRPYTQLHGEFTAYVSIIDLIANEGPNAQNYINSQAISWKHYIPK